MDGRVHYHLETRYDRINKTQYKNYLTTLSLSLRKLINSEKETVKNATPQCPLTRSQTVRALNEPSSERTTISVRQHGAVLQGQISFFNSLVDIVRKQLTEYRAIINNLAELTKQIRKEIKVITT